MRLKVPKEFLFPHSNTLRFRISVLYVAIIGLILLVLQVILYFNYAHSVAQEFDTQLQMKAEQIGGAVNTFRDMLGDQRQAFTMASQKALDLSIEYPKYTFMSDLLEKFWLADAKKIGLDKDYLAILDKQGRVITSSGNVTKDLLSDFENMGRSQSEKDRFFIFKSNGSTVRVVAAPYFYTYKQGYLIAVGSRYDSIKWILLKHFLFITASTSVFLVIASLIVRVFVIKVLSSVREISNVARNISQENLHARIKLTHTDDEIEHLTVSLNNMIERLEKSFAHIRECNMEMAHEVKTPLAIISGESQLALQKDRTTEEYKQMFRTVLKEARRSQKFVSDLLLLTKLDYRLIKLRFESIDLAEFLQEISDKIQVITNPKGVVVQQDIPNESMLIKGDRIHLRRVFFNLIDNALRFTPQRGIICFSAKRDGQKAVVLVSDTGAGITRDQISKIYRKFYRVIENQDQTDPEGGLGLSIAHSIVTLHGGTISIHSELGKGTTFRLEFPLI